MPTETELLRARLARMQRMDPAELADYARRQAAEGRAETVSAYPAPHGRQAAEVKQARKVPH